MKSIARGDHKNSALPSKKQDRGVRAGGRYNDAGVLSSNPSGQEQTRAIDLIDSSNHVWNLVVSYSLCLR